MARPQKKGLDYFPFDIDFFDDVKIKIVRAKFGSDGVLLYIYLLCTIYKNGFYIVCDDDFRYVISDDLGMSEDKIGQMLSFFLKRSLFDDTLFKADKILTSTGIQRRFQEAVKQRASKNPVQVSEKLWLISKNETMSFIKVCPVGGYSENNEDYSENNPPLFREKVHKVKESKVKESKVKYVAPAEPANTYGRHVKFTEKQYEELCEKYGDSIVKSYISKIDEYLEHSGKKPYSNHYNTIVSWLEKDKVKPRSDPSFDLKAIMEHAKNHSPEV